MIKVLDLHKSFGKNEVLKGISTEINEKEVVCVIGPSGSGKSTFLRCLNRLEEITSGEVHVNGINIADSKVNINQIREDVGMVFQHFNLFPHKTVLENVTLAPLKVKKENKEMAKQAALALLEKVGLGEKANAFQPAFLGGKSSVLQSLVLCL